MAATLANATVSGPLSRLESLRLSPAKANLAKTENAQRVGAALTRAIGILGLTIKEAAGLLDLDPAQLSRKMAGVERIQMDRIYSTLLHGPFAIEMARDAAGCTVETTVPYRRTA